MASKIYFNCYWMQSLVRSSIVRQSCRQHESEVRWISKFLPIFWSHGGNFEMHTEHSDSKNICVFSCFFSLNNAKASDYRYAPNNCRRLLILLCGDVNVWHILTSINNMTIYENTFVRSVRYKDIRMYHIFTVYSFIFSSS